MVRLLWYKRKTLLIRSRCCHKFMRCNDTDFMDRNDIYKHDWWVQIRGRCPYCKTRYRDCPGPEFFYAENIEDITSEETEESTNGRNPN